MDVLVEVRRRRGRAARRSPDAAASLPESELPRIRQDYLRNLSVQLTQPQSIAGAAFGELLYPESSLRQRLPDARAAAVLHDRRRAQASTQANFGAQRTHVYVAGKFDRAAIEKAIRDQLGQWREGPAPLAAAAARSPARRACEADRSSRRAAIDAACRHARHRSDAAGLHGAVGREHVARRRADLAHHHEPARRQRLGLLAEQQPRQRTIARPCGRKTPM